MSQGKHEIEVLYVPLKQWHCSWTLHTVAALRQHQQKTRTKRHQKDAISTHLSHNLVNRHQKWLKGCLSSASCPLRTAVDGGKTGWEEGGGRKGSCTLLMEIASNKVKPTSTKCLSPKKMISNPCYDKGLSILPSVSLLISGYSTKMSWEQMPLRRCSPWQFLNVLTPEPQRAQEEINIDWAPANGWVLSLRWTWKLSSLFLALPPHHNHLSWSC